VGDVNDYFTIAYAEGQVLSATGPEGGTGFAITYGENRSSAERLTLRRDIHRIATYETTIKSYTTIT
jgi:hypothetical protein